MDGLARTHGQSGDVFGGYDVTNRVRHRGGVRDRGGIGHELLVVSLDGWEVHGLLRTDGEAGSSDGETGSGSAGSGICVTFRHGGDVRLGRGHLTFLVAFLDAGDVIGVNL